MPKSQRLLELMLTVNRKRKFTVGELADQMGVSKRTVLRDLQELGELGVPLYSEPGRHGGYRVLNERVLPPIAFSESEAVAMFFAYESLQHYGSLPFDEEAASALGKFYHHLPGDVRDRIDRFKHRIELRTAKRPVHSPFLKRLLEASIAGQVVRIRYESKSETTERDIQPIGIYENNGFWYCPAYCFAKEELRLFRVDRIVSMEERPELQGNPDLAGVHLGNWDRGSGSAEWIGIRVSLTREGVRRCRAEWWATGNLTATDDGEGQLEAMVPASELAWFSTFFLGLGTDAKVEAPPQLVDSIRKSIADLAAHYR